MTDAGKDSEIGFDLSFLKKVKKPIFALSIFLGFVGVGLAIILAIITNGVIDSAEKAVIPQLDAAGGILLNLEQTTSDAAIMVGQTNTTISDVKTTMNSLKVGVAETSESLLDLGTVLKTLNLGVISLASYGNSISTAGSSLGSAANNIDKINLDLDDHAKDINAVKQDIEGLRASISIQKDTLAKAKSNMLALFSGLRLANLVGAVMFLLMFGVLILNGIGGIIGD